ncbi:DUF6573 family protein [Streptomyces pseudovenezuelae]|uniref:Uncharacterized protein n=1 Tax=Streptomyces pseudovenezuelae TaxID=67350 RepID=A0ABT6M5D1_9ACTN|nr:DUF6573 family protein [Streptomyces pseudovenezuelae]MDH6222839.1 hypothetical protein [Streptomyces pseudovenezuelae]
MTTIRRNWTQRVTEIRTAARTCRAYDSDSGNTVTVDPARAFEAWERTPRARLTEDTPGQQWTVHVHSNHFYILTAEDPGTGPADTAPAAETPAPPTAALDAQPSGGHDRSTARTPARRSQASGVPGHDHPADHASALAVGLVGKTVRVKRAQGLTREQIRDQFEQLRADAQAAGDSGKVTATETMLTVHAIMAAEETTAQTPSGPADGRTLLVRIDSVLHEAAVSGDAMRSLPLAEPDEIIHAYTRAQALADGTLTAADAESAREAGFVVPVALTSAVWEGCVAWNDGDSERQVPQDERGRLWDILHMARAAIRRGGGDGDRVTFDLRRVPRDGRTRMARPVQLVCAIGPGDQGEPVITIMEPHED